MIFGESPTAYFGNDADGIIMVRFGSEASQLTGTQIPAKCYVGGPFYDRLLGWHGKRLYYTRTNIPDDFSDPDTGNQQYLLVQHPEDITIAFTPGPDRTEIGFMGKLYVCTPTSTWIKNQDFGSGYLTKIHETAGVAAMNSVAWTDRGAVGLGINDVWLFPIDGSPIAIGGQIKPVLEDIPSAQLHRCSGVFRNGFYQLSITQAGQGDPNIEYWCDLRAYNANRGDKGIYWIGPIIRGSSGKGIECFLYQSQAPDALELMAFSSQDGRMVRCEDDTTYLDYGETMTSILETADINGGTPMAKAFTGLVAGFYVSEHDLVTAETIIDDTLSSTVHSLSIGAESAKWDEAIWDLSAFAGPHYYLVPKLFINRPAGSTGRLRLTQIADQEFSLKELYLTVEPFGRI